MAMNKFPLAFRIAAKTAAMGATLTASLMGQTPTRVACIGNSITQGTVTGVTPYPVKLQDLLGTGYSVQNDGVSTCTLLKKGNKPYWTQGKLSNVFAFKPNIVTIKLGTNDSKDVNWVHKNEFAKDLAALVDTLRGISSKPKIFLCFPAPAWPVDGVDQYTIHGAVIEKEIIPIIDSVARAKGAPTIDLHTPLLGLRSHFADGVHPDQVGQDTIAQVIAKAIAGDNPVKASAPGTAEGVSHRIVGEGLQIDLPADLSARAEILGLGGRSVGAWDVKRGGAWLSLPGLAPGSYLLSLRLASGGTVVLPFDKPAAR
jgi:acyl-CoA thioesterase-1